MIDDREVSRKKRVCRDAGASPSASGAVKIQVVRIIEEKQFLKE